MILSFYLIDSRYQKKVQRDLRGPTFYVFQEESRCSAVMLIFSIITLDFVLSPSSYGFTCYLLSL